MGMGEGVGWGGIGTGRGLMIVLAFGVRAGLDFECGLRTGIVTADRRAQRKGRSFMS